MYYYQIDKNGMYLDLYILNSHPTIEKDGKVINDPNFIATPIPNNIYFGEKHPPKWNGTEWVEGGEAPEPQPVQLTPEELKIKQLEEQLKQTNEDINMFMDFVLSGGM